MSTACAEITVELAWSPRPQEVLRTTLHLPAGATLGEALRASGWPAEQGWNATELRVGIWGKPKALDDVLRDRDRVEVYRPLLVDPKEARRQRYRKQRAAVKPGAG
jgi:hypothetical protein